MSHEPEIILSPDRNVLRRISSPQTLAVAWDASADPDFLGSLAGADAYRASNNDDDLVPVERYAQSIIDNEIHPILTEMGRFNGYDPLDIWTDEVSADIIPHRDHRCIGIFFYFNRRTGLSTFCVPAQYAGNPQADRSYPDADLSRAITFSPCSIALIKLGELTHFAPSEIPAGDCRVVGHARYDY